MWIRSWTPSKAATFTHMNKTAVWSFSFTHLCVNHQYLCHTAQCSNTCCAQTEWVHFLPCWCTYWFASLISFGFHESAHITYSETLWIECACSLWTIKYLSAAGRFKWKAKFYQFISESVAGSQQKRQNAFAVRLLWWELSQFAVQQRCHIIPREINSTPVASDKP